MDASTRQTEILALLDLRDRVEADDLAQRFGVSVQTVRADLRDLAERNALSRIHGGAVRIGAAQSQGYADRRRLNAPSKQSMAQLAADMIPDHCSITLNIGTSTEQVARALCKHRGLTVLSNNINIINIMLDSPAKELVLMGGIVRQSDGAIVGEDAVEFINRYKVDYAVIGASAMDSDGAILDHDAREVAVARAILKNARTRVLVCDSSKFQHSAAVRICDLTDLDVVITDASPPARFCKAAAAAHTQILTPGPNEDETERNENDQ